MALSQDAFFLGYPFGMGTYIHEVQAWAFVKKGIISSFGKLGGVRRIFLDGMNNPGFSGGPVVADIAGSPHPARMCSGSCLAIGQSRKP